MAGDTKTILWFETIGRGDVARVGGKNASLGEMVRELGAQGVRVPPGFATSADAFRTFMAAAGLDALVVEASARLADDRATLAETGAELRAAVSAAAWPEAVEAEIRRAWRELAARMGGDAPAVAVRSSATAEDLPEASFAGQQESFLNVTGEDALLTACRSCFASLFTDRAIAYRRMHGFADADVALSVGVQAMVRADLGASGVMFSLDTETGFDGVVQISAAWGLGETVVQGSVDPDEYRVCKAPLADPARVPIVARRLGSKEIKMILDRPGAMPPVRVTATSAAERARFVLDDADILALARLACTVERHYGVPMDMEWARDGRDGALYIVQARPETVQSRRDASVTSDVRVTPAGPRLLTGLSVGADAAVGRACVIEGPEGLSRFVDGAVLVTGATDPDWAPVMKRAAAIVTDHGGRTSHAAIVSRELGLPAVVGTGDGTRTLHDGQDLTVSCAEGDVGVVYAGEGRIEREALRLDDLPETRTKVMLNIADPSTAARWWRLPADGVGLARMEFVINERIGVHPMAVARFADLDDAEAKAEIARRAGAWPDPEAWFVDELAMGLAGIAAVWPDRPAIVRMSDFKSNEYAALAGGRAFEPEEENPMLGFRGASRYRAAAYREGFALECRAIRRLREVMGMENVRVMIPFCRTPEEADGVLAEMARHGLRRGEGGLEVYVMCEIPSNVIRATEFAERFDGFSIGSNDLTQLTLGVDRDSEALAHLFRADDPAVLWMIREVTTQARAAGRKVGLCGQAPSDDPGFARLLVAAGLDSISVTPDSFVRVKRIVAEAEAALDAAGAGGG